MTALAESCVNTHRAKIIKINYKCMFDIEHITLNKMKEKVLYTI